jgi:predicted transcriptional regulator
MAQYVPTDSELEILHVLWDKECASVRDVHETLSSQKQVKYTTTLKLMQIMHEKGLVSCDKSKKIHLYKPIANIAETRDHFVNKVTNHLFKGSKAQMVLHALGNQPPSKDEINAIQQYLDQLKSKTDK